MVRVPRNLEGSQRSETEREPRKEDGTSAAPLQEGSECAWQASMFNTKAMLMDHFGCRRTAMRREKKVICRLRFRRNGTGEVSGRSPGGSAAYESVGRSIRAF